MITTNFKIALRSLKRNKVYTFINISGLAIGMAACLLIFLVVRYELSYDTFQPSYSDIYHVVTQDKETDGIDYTPGVPFPALDAMRADFPQIKVTGLFATYGTQITVPDLKVTSGKKFIESNGVFFCEPQFFDVFSYKWLVGNASVLKDPNTVILTKSIAVKYFGNWENVIGKMIRIDNIMNMKVSGVIDDIPNNTDYPICIIASFITLKDNHYYGYNTDWGSTTSSFQVFMLLPKNVTPDHINEQFKLLAKKYYKSDGVRRRINFLQPLSKIHFDTEIPGLGDHVTSYSTLITLGMIGFLIIVMACINFVNLSTAQAITRSKEIGVRKVLGSSRKQLFWQVMSETNLIVLVSTILSLILAKLALPYIKYIISINDDLNLLTMQNSAFMILVVIVVTILSGVYPALILSGFSPVMALKNKIGSATIGGISLRRALVITQFVIAQMLIVGTIVAVSQMDFIRTADLGFNKEAVLVLYSSTDSSTLVKHTPFKRALLQMPDVKMVSLSSDVPSSDNNSGTNFAFDHRPDEDFTLYRKFGDADYFKTFDLKFVAGEAYQENDTAGKVIVNETFLKKLNVKTPQEAIGKEIRTGSGRWRSIIGVVKDFKTNSLRDEVKPILISSRQGQFNVISIKLNSTNLSRSKLQIEKLWDKYFPEYAYNSTFMDESIEQFYRQEKQMALLYKIFAGLAIFISCLGLYGLVSFMAVQRTKEVGIRKVLGAGVGNIVLLFSKEFTILIAIAFVIAAPLSWYFMNNWLNNFAYRIDIGWSVFVIAMVISLMVAWISVGYRAFRAALANPVKSLKTE